MLFPQVVQIGPADRQNGPVGDKDRIGAAGGFFELNDRRVSYPERAVNLSAPNRVGGRDRVAEAGVDQLLARCRRYANIVIFSLEK